jgi:glycine cleavage system aminomethyltransferase T
LNKPIGTALIAAGFAGSGELTVDIRGNRLPLRIAVEPFVK